MLVLLSSGVQIFSLEHARVQAALHQFYSRLGLPVALSGLALCAAGRHVLTELVTSPFIPNDTEMGPEAGRIQVIAELAPKRLTRVLQPTTFCIFGNSRCSSMLHGALCMPGMQPHRKKVKCLACISVCADAQVVTGANLSGEWWRSNDTLCSYCIHTGIISSFCT